ncbi:hypothetical protein L198_05855 [Cryptococcus wingfieldii CBS 7118]|uniref:Uncharacterized protein n=1 Tax=Cryptococcus wingfieldii CBS 7118 TaxID=1295528 RepID=A0A1E3IRV5_9TREE|nr:hypothetical protein L198_05855 [Cryptococcus wingfieldii CBS 7118]ODN91344.1 hypothetical protein L198_05855 [Cryptococcus wingfieldii CBS 7118]
MPEQMGTPNNSTTCAGGNVKSQQSTIWPSKGKEVEIKVVSADGIALYVPEHLLKSHSEVLRSMINDIGSTDTRLIEFSDPDIEGYKTLHLFLAVVTQNSLEGAIARDETGGGRGETLLSALDLPHIAAKVIELYTPKTDAADSASKSPTSTWPFLLSGGLVDIGKLEDEAWQVIPGKYLRALHRASTNSAGARLCSYCNDYTSKEANSAQRAAKFLEEVTGPKKN